MGQCPPVPYFHVPMSSFISIIFMGRETLMKYVRAISCHGCNKECMFLKGENVGIPNRFHTIGHSTSPLSIKSVSKCKSWPDVQLNICIPLLAQGLSWRCVYDWHHVRSIVNVHISYSTHIHMLLMNIKWTLTKRPNGLHLYGQYHVRLC